MLSQRNAGGSTVEIWTILGSAVGGGICAGLGVLLSYAFPKRWRGAAAAALAALGVVAGGALGRYAVTYWPGALEQSQATAEAGLLKDPIAGPVFQAWKDVDPAAYNEFMRSMLRNATSGKDMEALINEAREKAMAQVNLAKLSDSDIVEMARVTADQLHELRSTHPQSCVGIMHGKPLGDMRPHLSKEVAQREAMLLAAAFRASKSPVGASLSASEMDQQLAEVLAPLQAEYGADVALLGPSADAKGKEVRVCEIGAALFNAIAAEPPSDAAKLMRALLSSSSQ